MIEADEVDFYETGAGELPARRVSAITLLPQTAVQGS